MKIPSSPLTLLMLSLLCLPALWGCNKEEPSLIHEPIKSESALASTGSETRWSRIAFGSYPSREIVPSTWNAIEPYALEAGDIEKNDELYRNLSSAAWDKDRLTLSGVTYIREMPSRLLQSEQHYRIDELTYHYFALEPIYWRVIEKEGDTLSLLADRALDAHPFNESGEEATWETSSLRRWLNDVDEGFLGCAFNEQERHRIVLSQNQNAENPTYHTSSGNPTEDYVYILSNDEVYGKPLGGRHGFYPGSGYDDPAKRFTSTPYAKFHGTWYSPVDAYKGNAFWCMRSSGYNHSHVTYICDFGYIYSRGTSVDISDAGVVPSLKINVKDMALTILSDVSSLSIIKQGDAGKENTCVPGERKEPEIVSFGSYPQTEVVSEASGEEDCLVDPSLYATLESLSDDQIQEVAGERYLKEDGRYFRFDPISWRVLERKDGASLLFPTLGLDVLPYNTTLEDTYWSDSSIRGWLNDDFLSLAFTGKEDRVKQTKVENKRNFYFDTYCGEDTLDYVFLLSEEEIFCSKKASDYGFACSDATADTARMLKPSRYAKAKGAWYDETSGNSFFMLRTNGYNPSNAVYVNDDGNIYNRGMPLTCDDAMVVMALWVEDSALAR